MILNSDLDTLRPDQVPLAAGPSGTLRATLGSYTLNITPVHRHSPAEATRIRGVILAARLEDVGDVMRANAAPRVGYRWALLYWGDVIARDGDDDPMPADSCVHDALLALKAHRGEMAGGED